MPELPEVETVRIQLTHKIVGKEISGVEVFHQKTVGFDEAIEDRLVGKTFSEIDRIGKLLIFSFDGEDDVFLLAHLKMTGQFFYVERDGEVTGGGHSMAAADLELPNSHTRVSFHFTDHTTMHFNDMRLFGYTKLADAKTVEVAKAGFGPEPIDPEFDCEWFVTELRKKKTPVKAALLNQAFVAGLGNIYVDEALWRARVRPMRKANRVTKAEAAILCKAAGDVMRESIEVGGTTFQHFRDTGGENGNFTDYLQVFGQQGKACSRCGGIIEKTRCAGRGTHYCPSCQS